MAKKRLYSLYKGSLDNPGEFLSGNQAIFLEGVVFYE